MNVSVVAAVDLGGGIGLRGDLPWGRIPEDLRRFRSLTMGRAVVCGVRTFDAMPDLGSRRPVVVVSSSLRKSPFGLRGCRAIFWRPTLASAMEYATTFGEDAAIVGGARLFREAIEGRIASDLHLTVVHGHYTADTFFPFDEPGKIVIPGYEWAGHPEVVFPSPPAPRLAFWHFRRKI